MERRSSFEQNVPLLEASTESERPKVKAMFSLKTLLVMVNLMQIFYLGMNGLGKIVMGKEEGGVDLFEFTFGRSVILCITSIIILLYQKRTFAVKKEMRTFLTIRTVAGTLTFLGACVGIKTLPMTWFTLIT